MTHHLTVWIALSMSKHPAHKEYIRDRVSRDINVDKALTNMIDRGYIRRQNYNGKACYVPIESPARLTIEKIKEIAQVQQ